MTAEKPFRDTFRKTSGKNIGETRETAVNAGIPSVRTRPAKTKTAETRPASADASGSGSVPDSGFVHTHGTDRPVRFPWYRLILLAFAVLAAVTGMLTALNRAGLPALHQPRPLVAAHGALMVFGFMGTAIGMERGGPTGPVGGAIPVGASSHRSSARSASSRSSSSRSPIRSPSAGRRFRASSGQSPWPSSPPSTRESGCGRTR